MSAAAPSPSPEDLRNAITLRLGLLGCSTGPASGRRGWTDLAEPIFARHREMTRQMVDRFSPVDGRIQHFLNQYLAELGLAPTLPLRTFVLDQPGLARELSLPDRGDAVDSPLLKSYRLRNGVLHNPRSDRRTTVGTFHIAEGGLPIPGDKKAVPKAVFARLLDAALHPSHDSLRLPFTANRESQAETFVSLYLRPLVRPARSVNTRP